MTYRDDYNEEVFTQEEFVAWMTEHGHEKEMPANSGAPWPKWKYEYDIYDDDDLDRDLPEFLSAGGVIPIFRKIATGYWIDGSMGLHARILCMEDADAMFIELKWAGFAARYID